MSISTTRRDTFSRPIFSRAQNAPLTMSDTAREVQKSSGTGAPLPQTIDRSILPMINISAACLREGIVDNAEVVDHAMVFGSRFALFRGGSLNYSLTGGPNNLVAARGALAQKFSQRFASDARWDSFPPKT